MIRLLVILVLFRLIDHDESTAGQSKCYNGSDIHDGKDAKHDTEPSVWIQQLTMTKYMMPLIFCMMVPSLSEQVSKLFIDQS